MFRKTWKHLKILIFIVLILACIPRSILPLSSQSGRSDYMRMNDDEKRLIEFKDSKETLELKLSQLELINKSRKRFNAKPLKLDILASRVANKISREAAENNFTGHWDLSGHKPYHRYAFAGGNDHVTENAYAEWSTQDYSVNSGEISRLMREGHESFMAEKAPNDGHKQTVIDKSRTHVGIGYHIAGNQFRYYEEYIGRLFEFEKIPREVRPGEKTSITVRTDGKNFLYFIIVYYEPFPGPLNAKEISRRSSYSDFTDHEHSKLPAWELAKYRNGPYYTIPLTFKNEGLYYIQIFTDKKEITRPADISTKGKVPYSGIVITVRREA